MGDEEERLSSFLGLSYDIGYEPLAQGIQGGGRLIKDDHRRVQYHGHGQEYLLDLAAAELMRVPRVVLFGHPSFLQKAGRLFPGLIPTPPFMLDDRFRHLINDPVDRIQTRGPLLKDHG